MSNAAPTQTERLFQRWRNGDAAAGNAMAQQFTDWYYAIAVCRLGEPNAGEPFRAACSHFSKGVVKVTEARSLKTWAHHIAKMQIRDHVDQGWLRDGDLPNAFSRSTSPKQMLLRAREALPAEMQVLEDAYVGRHMPADYAALLEARYAVKLWLRKRESAPFKVTPPKPDLDLTPLPFYESAKMRSQQEEAAFELFMLEDNDTCQDIVEFAHFALALRGGLPRAEATSVAPAGRVDARGHTPGDEASTPRRDTPTSIKPHHGPAPTTDRNTHILALVAGLVMLLGVLWMAGYIG